MDLSAIPHLDQFAGPWAILPSSLTSLHQWLMQTNITIHLASPEAAEARSRGYGAMPEIIDGVAFVYICGRMMKHQMSAGLGCSTVLARREVRAARANPRVSSILLHIDSPGGTAAGTAELADDVAAAAKVKPVYAYIEDLGCSAAYWVASQASKIFANRTAEIGSIGTYSVIHDQSGRAAKEGVRVHVVRAGEFKGWGVAGTLITDAHLAELQREVNALNEHFVKAVASGRKISMDGARALADGRVHIAEEARKLGLIDGIATIDGVFQALSRIRPSVIESSKAAAQNEPEREPYKYYNAYERKYETRWREVHR